MRKNKIFTILTILASFVIIISFFLPWASDGLSAFDMQISIFKIFSSMRNYELIPEGLNTYLPLSLLVLPFFSLLIIIREVLNKRNKQKSSNLLEAAIIIVLAFFIFYVLINSKYDVNNGLMGFTWHCKYDLSLILDFFDFSNFGLNLTILSALYFAVFFFIKKANQKKI
jgi:hypothetical protein